MSQSHDIETLLRSALVPVEPSGALGDRLERGLAELTEAAAGELADWELSAMRDPRAWGRLVAALVVGGAAAAGLALLRVRRRQRRPAPIEAVRTGLRELYSELGNRVGR